jgi:hypothetical protein
LFLLFLFKVPFATYLSSYSVDGVKAKRSFLVLFL